MIGIEKCPWCKIEKPLFLGAHDVCSNGCCKKTLLLCLDCHNIPHPHGFFGHTWTTVGEGLVSYSGQEFNPEVQYSGNYRMFETGKEP